VCAGAHMCIRHFNRWTNQIRLLYKCNNVYLICRYLHPYRRKSNFGHSLSFYSSTSRRYSFYFLYNHVPIGIYSSSFPASTRHMVHATDAFRTELQQQTGMHLYRPLVLLQSYGCCRGQDIWYLEFHTTNNNNLYNIIVYSVFTPTIITDRETFLSQPTILCYIIFFSFFLGMSRRQNIIFFFLT